MFTPSYEHIHHDCIVQCTRSYPPGKRMEPKWRLQLKKFWYKLTLFSEANPQSKLYFRSDKAAREEKMRHYYSKNYYIIHPLSRLAAYLEAFQLLLYLTVMWLKPFDVAFLRRHKFTRGNYNLMVYVMNFCDVFSWLNLASMFMVGYVIPKHSIVITDRSKIAKRCLFSVLFWIEAVSSLPKYMICRQNFRCNRIIWSILTVTSICKIGLVGKVVPLLKSTAQYIGVTNRRVIKILQFVMILWWTTHFISCLGYLVPHMRRWITGEYHPQSWVLYDNLTEKTLMMQYFAAYFKCSAQTFGVHIEVYKEYATWEETVITLLSYFGGTLIQIVTWIALAFAVMARDLPEVKFQEMVTELNEYLRKKQLPNNLSDRILKYYHFKFQEKFVNQKNIMDLLPDGLKNKVNIERYHVIKESYLNVFNLLTEHELQEMISHFVSQIFSPNDVIIMSGSITSSLYVLAYGTVAVYTHSGKEVCHLQDGAYFGELALILKKQRSAATIIAVETTKVLKLERRQFLQFITRNKKLYDQLLVRARERLKELTQIEDEYKNILFRHAFSSNT